jgi:DNA-binding response OmpR family regulator
MTASYASPDTSPADPATSGSAGPRSSSPADPAPSGTAQRLAILLYSDDLATRDAVRLAVGRRPARDVEVTSWRECATAAAVIEAVETGEFDLLILDGEAARVGGLGLCRQLKNEIFSCPPVLVLTGRPQDAWLAAWSQADLAVPHPLDPIALAGAVAELGRMVGASTTSA